jgi:hypothetical protein
LQTADIPFYFAFCGHGFYFFNEKVNGEHGKSRNKRQETYTHYMLTKGRFDGENHLRRFQGAFL